MKLKDIQKSITKLLHDNFEGYKIVLEQQSDVKQPTFFVNIKKLKTDNHLFFKDKLIVVTITYVNKEYNHVENNDINDMLDNIFKHTLKVNNDYLTIENLDFNEPDALICSFDLKYREEEVNEEIGVKMEELIQNY